MRPGDEQSFWLHSLHAFVAELAYALGLGPSGREIMGVRVSPNARNTLTGVNWIRLWI